MASVTVKRLWKEYGQQVVLENLNLTIADGEFVTIVGASGCGKTTFLRMLLGVEKPTRGELLIDGQPIPAEPGPEPMHWSAPLPDGRAGRYVARLVEVHHVYPEAGPERPEGRHPPLGHQPIHHLDLGRIEADQDYRRAVGHVCMVFRFTFSRKGSDAEVHGASDPHPRLQ